MSAVRAPFMAKRPHVPDHPDPAQRSEEVHRRVIESIYPGSLKGASQGLRRFLCKLDPLLVLCANAFTTRMPDTLSCTFAVMLAIWS